MTFLSSPPPRVLAHRGLAVDGIPENTMLAFAKAVETGVSIIESDVHATADGVAVLAHDPSLDRVAGRDVMINATLHRELRAIPLGHDQVVPDLSEALLAFPDTHFNLDLKADDAVIPTVRAVIEARAEHRVLLTSFKESRRKQAAALLPGVASSASQSIVVRALAAERLGLRRGFRAAVDQVAALQVPRRHGPVTVVTRRLIEWSIEAGVEVHVWTINDPTEMHELLDLGVHGIVTDRADLALDVLASR